MNDSNHFFFNLKYIFGIKQVRRYFSEGILYLGHKVQTNFLKHSFSTVLYFRFICRLGNKKDETPPSDTARKVNENNSKEVRNYK